jgi:polyferredoxin
VHCTQCIDACDDVMTRIGKPKGLIRYSSQDAMAGKPRKLLRLRTVLYPLVLCIMLGGLITSLVTKDTADITVLRSIGAPFGEDADGRISNQIRVKIANRAHTSAQYAIVVTGLESAGLQNSEVTVVAPENPMTIAGGATRETSMFILLPRRAFTNGERNIVLTISDGHSSTQEIPFRLLGPSGGASR